MKINRLISIIMVLLERKKVSAAKLAEMFEVSPRTIYRDIETICQAGIPIITYPGGNGGIGIVEEYKIDKNLFTSSDITSLLIGLSSIPSELSSKELLNTISKVKGLIPAGQISDIELKSNQISIDLTPWVGNKNIQLNLEKINIALNEQRLLTFKYSDYANKKSIRKVEPYKLVLKGANWYLQSYCTSKQDYRNFKLARISMLEVLDEAFIHREFQPIEINISGWEDRKLIRIKLLIDESIKEEMMDICGEENVELFGENKYIAYFPFQESDWGYKLLLSFGEKCECLEPSNVRAEIIRRINNLSAVYN